MDASVLWVTDDWSARPATALHQTAGPTPGIPKAGFKEETCFLLLYGMQGA